MPATLTDGALEALLFVGTGIAPGTRRKTEPDWPALHRELRRPGVTLMLLWQDRWIEHRVDIGCRKPRIRRIRHDVGHV